MISATFNQITNRFFSVRPFVVVPLIGAAIIAGIVLKRGIVSQPQKLSKFDDLKQKIQSLTSSLEKEVALGLWVKYKLEQTGTTVAWMQAISQLDPTGLEKVLSNSYCKRATRHLGALLEFHYGIKAQAVSCRDDSHHYLQIPDFFGERAPLHIDPTIRQFYTPSQVTSKKIPKIFIGSTEELFSNLTRWYQNSISLQKGDYKLINLNAWLNQEIQDEVQALRKRHDRGLPTRL